MRSGGSGGGLPHAGEVRLGLPHPAGCAALEQASVQFITRHKDQLVVTRRRLINMLVIVAAHGGLSDGMRRVAPFQRARDSELRVDALCSHAE